ncbi:carbohydrate binding domain-containing protein [[Eubacterium] cellulosolvens]
MTAPSNCQTNELVENGGFENGLDRWSTFGYDPQNEEAKVTDTETHFGKYSLNASIPHNEEDQVGRGARQTIYVNQPSNLDLSFWVNLGSIAGSQNLHTNIAMIVSFQIEGNAKYIIYNVAWDPREEIYKSFPLPTKRSDDVVNILIPAMMNFRWNHVERDLSKDFESSYPNINMKEISSITIELVAVRFQKVGFLIDVFWDDISLKGETEIATSPITPTPTQSEPTETPTLTETIIPPSITTETPPKETSYVSQVPVNPWTQLQTVATIMGTILAMVTLFVHLRRRN